MKILADKREVPPRIYYYLLEWNDRNNWEYMTETFDKTKLHELNIEEFKKLFAHAVMEDQNNL